MKRLLVYLLILIFCGSGISYAGEVTLSWTNPTKNTDESDIVDLAGHKIHSGFENLSTHNRRPVIIPTGVSITPGERTSYVVKGLRDGIYEFSISTIDFAGNESEESNTKKKLVSDIHKAITDLE